MLDVELVAVEEDLACPGEGLAWPGRGRGVGLPIGPGRAPASTAAAPSAARAASTWTPEAATYGVGSLLNQAVTAKDGTILRADVYFPTTLTTGAAAAGPFPVLLTQTPYGKDVTVLGGGPDNYLVPRGYIEVVADVRGTGGSEGEWGLFDPVQATDGATFVDFAAAQPHSDGKVGLIGASYLGVNQFGTAAVAGPTHVKAMFPMVSGSEIYRDSSFAGGFPDMEFDATFLGQTAAFNTLFPASETNTDLAKAETDHIRGLADYQAATLADIEKDGDGSYDGSYWLSRSPVNDLEAIGRAGIPAFLIGGWFDIFQRGEMLNYSGLQNAYAGRPVGAPMTPDEPTSSRYQLLMGPWFHLTAGQGLNYRGLDLNGLHLAWFDQWLKDIDTGITDTPTGLHLEDLGTGKYQEASHYPLDQTTDHTYYLHPGGGLSTAKPAAGDGSDALIFTGTEVPCTSSTEQWAAGKGASTLSFLGLHDPCAQNATLSQQGPGTQSYTTTPFTTATTLAGPIGATLYAATSTTDSEWVVQLSDVAPDGTPTPLTSGLLEGRQRATDPTRTWLAPDGLPLLPYHPYTREAAAPATPGALTRYDVEVFPTFKTFLPGHSLRVTVATADFPHAIPEVAQLPGLVGGTYTLSHDTTGPSSVELPLAPLTAFTASPATAVVGSTATAAAPSPGAARTTRPAGTTPVRVRRVVPPTRVSRAAPTRVSPAATPTLPTRTLAFTGGLPTAGISLALLLLGAGAGAGALGLRRRARLPTRH